MPSPHAGSEREAPIDLRRIQETSEGDSAFERELFELFLNDSVFGFERLVGVLKAGHFEAARHEAHSLAGACANVGADGMFRCAKAAERAAEAEQAEAAAAAVDELKVELQLAQDFIKAYLESA